MKLKTDKELLSRAIQSYLELYRGITELNTQLNNPFGHEGTHHYIFGWQIFT